MEKQQPNPNQIACPRCKSLTDFRISRSKLLKMIFPSMKLKRYWCPNCRNKFYKRYRITS